MDKIFWIIFLFYLCVELCLRGTASSRMASKYDMSIEHVLVSALEFAQVAPETKELLYS